MMHQEWLPGIEQGKLIRKSFDIATALASHLSLKFEQVCCTSTKDQGGFWCEPHLHPVSGRKELRNKKPGEMIVPRHQNSDPGCVCELDPRQGRGVRL